MEQYLVSTYHDEQKRYRLKIYRDADCWDGPLDWGWHLNFADRDRNYSLDRRRENGEPMKELRLLVSRYGDAKRVREWLKQVDDRKRLGEDYAEYDRSERVWRLYSQGFRGDYYQETYFSPQEWHNEDSYLLEQLSDETLCTIANEMMTDGCKVASYDFCYYNGEPDFCDSVEERMRGLVWIEKADYLKDYSGLKDAEQRWATMKLTELMAGLLDSIQRWARGDVYGFVLEKAVNWQVHRECLSEEREAEDYEETEWEEVDSCWGYYEEPEDVAKQIEGEHGLPPMLEAA